MRMDRRRAVGLYGVRSAGREMPRSGVRVQVVSARWQAAVTGCNPSQSPFRVFAIFIEQHYAQIQRQNGRTATHADVAGSTSSGCGHSRQSI